MHTQVRRAGVRAGGDRPQAVLRVYLLGRFEVVRDDAPIPAHAWRRRRPADLLKLVALAPGRVLSRDQVVDTLWPDKDPASGANNLHRALYDLRQILGARWVDIARGEISLDPAAWVDVDAFDAAAARGDLAGLAEAVALYQGDLCPDDHELPWLGIRRAALRERFVAAAFPVARAAAADGDAHAALPLLHRLAELRPGDEDPHRAAVRLLAATGRRAEALRHLDACERALRAAGRSPSDELRALRDAIQRGEVGPAEARPALDGARRAARRLLGTTDPPPVRGRGPLVLLLEALVEQGAGAVVLLGERGVGKTRLAAEAARLAQARGAAVVCGIGGTLPGAAYAVFADALREEARADPTLADPLAAADGAGEVARRSIADALVAALRAIAQGRPLLLLLDDLHLADESSLGLVHLLARRARELRLMIVATVSEDAIHAGTPIQIALAHLDGGRLARGIRVPRLPLAGTREQVADLLGGAADEATVAHVHRITDGSPLLVEEVVRAQREGVAQPDDPAAAIRARTARLGPRAEALLAAAAACGPRFDVEIARRVSGLTAHDALAALEACLAARILDEDGAGHRFHHAVVRDALYEGLDPERRAVLHGAIADALERADGAAGPDAELLAWHRRRAGQDLRALRPLVAAGHRAAARCGLREALAFYGAALELSARTGGLAADGRRELLDATGRVQLGLGDVSGAARSFGEAARIARAPAGAPGSGAGCEAAEPAQRARLLGLAALSLAAAGQLPQAHRVLDEALPAADAAGEGRPRLQDLAALLRFHEGLVDEPPARPAEWPDAPIDPWLDLHPVLWDRDLLAGGPVAAVARAAARVSDRARREADGAALACGRLGEGSAALLAGDLVAAEVALREALREHRAAGAALGEALALEKLAGLLTAVGRIAEASDAIDEGIVAAERGTLRRHALVRLHAAAARNRLAAGALYAAEDAVRVASETASRHGECVPCDAALRPEAVRVLLLRGKIAAADEEAAQLLAIARARGGATLTALADVARARVLAAQGRPADAVTLLARARAGFLEVGQRYEAARCVRLEARLRGPDGAIPDEARALGALVTVDGDA
jgi:DNA-binding SARP family transcriptional activator